MKILKKIQKKFMVLKQKENDEIALDDALDEDERKEFENDENDNNSNIKGILLKLFSRIGSVGGNIWNIFYRTIVTSSQSALGIVFAAVGVIIGVGSSIYMTCKDGIELIPIFTKYFKKKKISSI